MLKIDKKCNCGLWFMVVDWLHHRKRGYCSYICRKTNILQKRNTKGKS